MRLLLDECVPRRLGQSLARHDVQTVQQAGWSGLKNGELLTKAAESFDVFVTVDQGIRYQQNIVAYDICVVALAARTNDIKDLRPLVPRLLEMLADARPGQVLRVAA